MNKIFTAITAIIGAAFAWFMRGFIADWQQDKLKKERDDALAWSKNYEISAKAKDIEATGLREQQRKEDGRNASDGNSVATELDNMFRDK